MIEFFHALTNPDFGYLRVGLFAGILASIACGIVGAYVVTRRITYIAGSISHCVLGGMGAARYMQMVHGWTWTTPLLGAVISAIAAALIIGWVTLRAKEREDTIIGALWAVGMAVGILFIQKTPGSPEDLMSYLFGSIVMVRNTDLWILILLDAVIVSVVAAMYHPLLAVCFDSEFSRLRGLPVEAIYLLLLCLTALTVVLLISVVGIVLVIALLTLPVAIAGNFCRTFLQTMLLSVVICMALTTTGLAVSFGPDLPAGATTIVLAGVVYLLVLSGRWLISWRTARK